MKFTFFLFERDTNFLDIDDCVSHTCANGGFCVDGLNSYLCNCSADYPGERCLTGNQTGEHYLIGRSKF